MRFFILRWIFLVCFPLTAVAANPSLWMSDIGAAKNLARKQKKPMLIDFFGIWCPPCNELDETVFNTPAFLAKSKAFILLKVDVDKPESWQIKDRYKVGGYPTLLFTDATGEEIYRVVGSRSAAELVRTMELAQQVKGRPLRSACKSETVEDLWRCALICNEKNDMACAKKAYSSLENRLPVGSTRYLQARTFIYENESPDLKRQGFLSLLKQFPASPLALEWAIEYLNSFGTTDFRAGISPDKALVETVLKNYPAMAAEPSEKAREELGIADTDFLQLKAEVLERLGKNDEAKKVWKEAADLFESKKAGLPGGVSPRGYTLEQISCLEFSGDWKKGLELAQEFRLKYPNEFTFYFLAAGLLERQKSFTEALPLAKRAYELAYGDNKIRSATLLVKLLLTQSNKTEVKRVLEEVNAAFKPDQKLEVRTHRYLKVLDDTARNALN